MTLMRHYRLDVAPADEPAFHAAAASLVATVRAVAGCEEASLFFRDGERGRYLLVERWASPDAYRAGAASLPKFLFAPLMALLAVPPASESWIGGD